MPLFLAGARLKVMEIMQKNEACYISISLSYEYVQKIIYRMFHDLWTLLQEVIS
jgi:hypothetical protein